MKSILNSVVPPLHRVALIVSAMVLICTGCDGPIKKRAMPAPIRDQVKTTLSGRIHRVWGGDNFEFGHELELHYIIVRGLDAPDPGEPLFRRSRVKARELTRGKTVEVRVVDRDEVMREIADVIVPVGKTKGDFSGDSFNLGVEMIRQGLARYNPGGFSDSQQDVARPYQDAEREAKEAGLGIWKTDE